MVAACGATWCNGPSARPWTYRDFLTVLETEEIAQRQQTRLARLSRRAHFPFLKTIDDFDFTYQSSAVRLNVMGSALSPDFVTRAVTGPDRQTGAREKVLPSPSRTGPFRTALMRSSPRPLRYRRALCGVSAGPARRALQTYTHPAVLVVDEVGYLTYGTDAANMLFPATAIATSGPWSSPPTSR